MPRPCISIIVAMDQNNAIGRDNNLLCYLPNDLKYFKSVTQGHTVIMGRNTYLSLPNGALPNRRNIILSRNSDFMINDGEVAASLDAAVQLCVNDKEIFVIGGGAVYEEAINIADKLYVTYIHHQFEEADTFFPEIDDTVWEEVSRQENEQDVKNKYSHSFVTYKRIHKIKTDEND